VKLFMSTGNLGLLQFILLGIYFIRWTAYNGMQEVRSMFAEKARIAQIKTGASWKKVAEKMGVKPPSVSGMLMTDNCKEETMKALADALGCDLEITLVVRETGERI